MQALRSGRQHQLFLLQLFKHGAQSGCMFSVLKATEKHVESHQKKKRPVFDKYASAVASFVESYVAANQSYPKVSEVVQHTGGSRSTIKKILNELYSEQKIARSEEVSVKGQDDMKEMHTIHSLGECMPSNIGDGKNSAWPCSDKSEQLAEEVDGAQVEASVDSMNAEMHDERIGVSVQNLEKKGFSALGNPALFTLLDQAMLSSNKADANRRVAPLMEVLQHKSSGSSRRVHLSSCGGIENDLSWEKTLQSIKPLFVDVKEDTSDLEDEQPKANREYKGHQFKVEQPMAEREIMGHLLSSSEECNESRETDSDFIFKIMIASSKVKSVLDRISVPQLRYVLIQQAEVFKHLKALKLFKRTVNTKARAILQFKDYESMKKAFGLKTVIIGEESFSLKEVKAATMNLRRGDTARPAGLGERSVFQEVMQGMTGSFKKENTSSKILHSPSYPYVEDKKPDVSLRAQHCLHPSFLQTISIQECPCNISLESIKSFFSVFGKVQTSYGAFTHGKPRGLQIVVEFENESDKEKAMKVQQFVVDGCSFQLRPAPSALVVQLKCERLELVKSIGGVVKACKQYCAVEKTRLKNPQIIEVTLNVNERHRINELLRSLREDAFLKEKWSISPVYEGYIKADFVPEWYKEKLGNIKVLLNELSIHIDGLFARDN